MCEDGPQELALPFDGGRSKVSRRHQLNFGFLTRPQPRNIADKGALLVADHGFGHTMMRTSHVSNRIRYRAGAHAWNYPAHRPSSTATTNAQKHVLPPGLEDRLPLVRWVMDRYECLI